MEKVGAARIKEGKPARGWQQRSRREMLVACAG